jgi:hypothetical protein
MHHRNRMPFKPKYTDEQWAEARRLRGEGFTYPRIAERLGFLRVATVARRAQAEGWSAAATAAASAPARSAAVRRPGAASPAATLAVRALALRLFGFVDLELRTLELRMKKKLEDYAKSPGGELPMVTPEEREAFANVIDNIKQVTEIASEPAIAADGRRKSATLDHELTALSDELDNAALAAASEKDILRREIADKLEKLVPPPAGS